MKIDNRLLVVPALCLGLSGCVLFGGGPGLDNTVPEKYILQPGARTPADVPQGHSEIIEPVLPNLYGRDGSPVSAQPAGSVSQRSPTHDIQNADGSRMYILELYQQAIEDKEALMLEVDALSASLERMQDLFEQSELRVGELRKMIEQQQKEKEQMRAESMELAARLTTAQIRRLEAEKLLLEAKLEWQRLQRAIEGSGAKRIPEIGSEKP